MSNPSKLTRPPMPSRSLSTSVCPSARVRRSKRSTPGSSASSRDRKVSAPSLPVSPSGTLRRRASTGDLKNLPRKSTKFFDVLFPGESLVQWRARLLENHADNAAYKYTTRVRVRSLDDFSLNAILVPVAARATVRPRAPWRDPQTREAQRRRVGERTVVMGSAKDRLISKLKHKVDGELEAEAARRRQLLADLLLQLPPGVELSGFATTDFDAYDDEHDEEDDERARAIFEEQPQEEHTITTNLPARTQGPAMVGLGISTRPGCGQYDGAGDEYDYEYASESEHEHEHHEYAHAYAYSYDESPAAFETKAPTQLHHPERGPLVSHPGGGRRLRNNITYSFPGEAASTASPATQVRLARWMAEKTAPRNKAGKR